LDQLYSYPESPRPGNKFGRSQVFWVEWDCGHATLEKRNEYFSGLSGVPSVSSRVFCFAWPSKIGAWNRKPQTANGYYREFDKLRTLFTAAKSAFDFMIFTVGNPPEGQQ